MGNGREFFEKHYGLIKKIVAFICAKHHLNVLEAQDFESFVNEKLTDNDCSRLDKFRGESHPKTYLATTIRRLFLDYCNMVWGKWRPSTMARRLGAVAVLLERYMVRDGFGYEETCETLQTNHGVALPRTQLDEIRAKLPLKARRRFESDEMLATFASPERPIDQILIDEVRERRMQQFAEAVNAEIAKFPASDQFILKMHFWDDMSVADVARLTGWDPKKLHPHLQKLLRILRKRLEYLGFGDL